MKSWTRDGHETRHKTQNHMNQAVSRFILPWFRQTCPNWNETNYQTFFDLAVYLVSPLPLLTVGVRREVEDKWLPLAFCPPPSHDTCCQNWWKLLDLHFFAVVVGGRGQGNRDLKWRHAFPLDLLWSPLPQQQGQSSKDLTGRHVYILSGGFPGLPARAGQPWKAQILATKHFVSLQDLCMFMFCGLMDIPWTTKWNESEFSGSCPSLS